MPKWIFMYYDGKLMFHINSPATFGINPVEYPWQPVVGQWYHVAVTRDGNTYVLYIDGVQVATGTDTHAVPAAVAPLTIGQAEGGINVSGLIASGVEDCSRGQVLICARRRRIRRLTVEGCTPSSRAIAGIVYPCS